jgi:hypothetical protein
MIERMNGPQDRSRNLLLVGERPSTHPLALDWVPQLRSAIPPETNRAGTSPPGKMGGEDSERPQTVLSGAVAASFRRLTCEYFALELYPICLYCQITEPIASATRCLAEIDDSVLRERIGRGDRHRRVVRASDRI